MKVHFIAIGGSAMHNLAIALRNKGFEVTGSDDAIFEPSKTRLEQKGILPKEFGWFPEKITADIDAVILGMHAHADNPELAKAKELGLKGIPSVCESVHIARDILLAEAAGAHYHVCHVSTKESVRVIADGKKAGIRVTAEVSPHHLVLTEDDIPNADTNYKMNPPLRAKEDQLALIKGLEEGIIDCIATDHAPHTEDEKSRGMYDSPFGIVGFETAFPVLHTRFVKTGKWSLKQLIDWMTIKPAEVFNLDKVGKIEVGYHADLTFIDLEKTQKVDKNTFVSKGRNTPFDGWECTGWPVATFVNGEKVY